MWLIVLCAAALSGLALGDVARLDAPRLALAALAAACGAALVWRQRGWRTLALVACALALGGLRSAVAQAPVDEAVLEPYFGQTLRVRAGVLRAPTLTARSAQVEVNVLGLGPAGRDPPPLAVSGGAAARMRVVGDPAVFGALQSNAALVLEGRLVADAADRSPTMLFPGVLEARSPPPVEPAGLLPALRAAADRGIHADLPEPQASLAAGVLLGGSSGLDADFRLDLQRAGLAHLLAIDGFKLVVVAGALSAVAVRVFGRPLATLPVCLGIAAYTLLTGAHPSAIRAALMVGLSMLATLCGRVADPLTSLLVAVVVMAGIEPPILLDVGLRLSLSAVLGIVLLWPRWRRRLGSLPPWVAEPAGLTLAVTLATLPVMLSVFDMVSLVSPFAHVLAVPLLAPVLAGAALLAVAAPIPLLGTLAGWLAWLPTTLLVEVVRVCGGLPGAAVYTGRLPLPAAACLAAAILAWGVLGLPEAAAARARWARLRVDNAPWRTPFAWSAMCLMAIGLLRMVQPDGRLHVQTLAAGRGEAVLIRGPTGRTLLVAAGHLDGASLAGRVADHLAIWEHNLDGVLSLDPAAEAGLRLTLEHYPPTQRLEARADSRIDLGGGATLDVNGLDASRTQGSVGGVESQDGASAGRPSEAGVSVSFGRVWLPIVGYQPAPAGGQPEQPSPVYAQATDLVTDGAELWADHWQVATAQPL